MELKGLKAVFLGDSITEGYRASTFDNAYWQVLGRRTGLEVKGYGVAASRIARQAPSDPPQPYDEDFVLRAMRMDKDADIVCVFGGTNDFGHGTAPIGKPTDRDPYTFYGAVNHLFRTLIERYPHSFIFVMTPLHRTHEDEPAFNTKNPNSLALVEYVRIIREVAEKYGLPVLDLFQMSGMYPGVQQVREDYMPDGLHPNDRGHARLAGLVEQFLRNSYYEKG